MSHPVFFLFQELQETRPLDTVLLVVWDGGLNYCNNKLSGLGQQQVVISIVMRGNHWEHSLTTTLPQLTVSPSPVVKKLSGAWRWHNSKYNNCSSYIIAHKPKIYHQIKWHKESCNYQWATLKYHRVKTLNWTKTEKYRTNPERRLRYVKPSWPIGEQCWQCGRAAVTLKYVAGAKNNYYQSCQPDIFVSLFMSKLTKHLFCRSNWTGVNLSQLIFIIEAGWIFLAFIPGFCCLNWKNKRVNRKHFLLKIFTSKDWRILTVRVGNTSLGRDCKLLPEIS